MVTGKYLGDRRVDREIRECELEEYARKSAGLESHLRYFEVEI